MSLRKAIESGKEHRKPYYRRAPSVDRTCRPHGGGSARRPCRSPCPWCLGNRTHSTRVREDSIRDQIKELK